MKDFICEDTNHFVVTDEMVKSYEADGYIMIRGLFSKEEMAKVEASATHIKTQENMIKLPDNAGKAMKLSLWNQPGHDLLGMVARCRKLVDTSEALLGDEAYHYHTKVMLKEPKVGGRQVWHQDYGYWYQNGCLFPNMVTAFIAVDATTTENGCLQVIRGSHKLGRIEHNFVGGQTGADMERINQILKNAGLIHENVIQQPGDCLIFHCNVLHTSEPNLSEKRRIAVLIAYNAKSNNPVIEHHHPQYTPLSKVENSAIMDCDVVFNPDGKDFMNPFTDKTTHGETLKAQLRNIERSQK